MAKRGSHYCKYALSIPHGEILMKRQTELYKMLNPDNGESVQKEVSELLHIIDEDFDVTLFNRIYLDTVKLFAGNYPGYQKSNTSYHNLEHTLSVLLATVRLLHGAYIEGVRFDKQNYLSAVIGALLHDSGLILRQTDREGTGAKYTIGHESRSILFAHHYMEEINLPAPLRSQCIQIIATTELDSELEGRRFATEQAKMMAQMVGTADLMAQMADRSYLEKLLLLFKEFKEAQLPHITTEEQLLRQTTDFYQNIAQIKLLDTYQNVKRYFIAHFREHCKVGYDLYQCAIDKNISYLQQLLLDKEDELIPKLRRDSIVESLGLIS